MRRDQFSRDSSFAAHLLLATLSFSAFFMLIAGAITFAPAVIRLEFGSGSLDQVAVLTREILEIHAVVWPVVVACLIAVTLTSLFLFNRMTEPLMRFVRVFDCLRRGEIPDPIELRGRDYLKREAQALNELTAGLHLRIGEIKRRQVDLSCAIEEVAEAVSRGDSEQLATLIGELGEHEKKLRESLAQFADPA
jgi:methyl-accepting chemotaxis protein